MNGYDETVLKLGREARIVRVCDNLDAVTAAQLVESFQCMSTEGLEGLVLDLSEVSFMDSAGIGAIIGVFRELRNSGVRLAVAGAVGQPLDLIKMVGLDSVVELCSEPTAAARGMHSPGSRTGEERDESLVLVKG